MCVCVCARVHVCVWIIFELVYSMTSVSMQVRGIMVLAILGVSVQMLDHIMEPLRMEASTAAHLTVLCCLPETCWSASTFFSLVKFCDKTCNSVVTK